MGMYYLCVWVCVCIPIALVASLPAHLPPFLCGGVWSVCGGCVCRGITLTPDLIILCLFCIVYIISTLYFVTLP